MRALESHPNAIGVTTWFTIHTADGAPRYEEYRGEFPTSPDPAQHFKRMLSFFHAGDAKYDPVYGMNVPARTAYARPPPSPVGHLDWLLSAELALMGPIINVDKRLANRSRESFVGVNETHSGGAGTPCAPTSCAPLRAACIVQLLALAVMSGRAPDGSPRLRQCRKRSLRRFWLGQVVGVSRSRAADVRHRALRRAAT